MNGEQKITPGHLSRKAFVYLRQSSEGQVKNNLESQRLQYALAGQATRLGFREVGTGTPSCRLSRRFPHAAR